MYEKTWAMFFFALLWILFRRIRSGNSPNQSGERWLFTFVGVRTPRDRGRFRDVRSTDAEPNIAGGKFNEKKHKQKADMSSSRGFDDCARFPLGDLRRGLGYKI
jgi:hypothetical protein